MKALSIFLFSAILSVNATHAQTADGLITSFLDKTQMNKVTSLKVEQVITMMGMNMEVTAYSKSPNKEYIETDVMGDTIITASDGEINWGINPFDENPEPKVETGEDKEDDSFWFDNDLFNYEEKGYAVSLERLAEIAGKEYWEVKMTKNEGEETLYYFDPETLLLCIMRWTDEEEGVSEEEVYESHFSDYREVDGGFLVAFSTLIKNNGKTSFEIIYTSIELNIDIDDSKFTMPK
ncbi:MAG: hypothetical protein P8P74_11015 [Crocinitomicaceae bacterium]|nr:hypothetical protein [Crocinitomicaceae bacterium]